MSRIAIMLGVTLLAGCVTQPQPLPEVAPDPVARRTALQMLPEWTFEGRMGIRFDGQGFSGAIQWHQQGERIASRFHGPLGAGAFTLEGSGDGVIIETGRGERFDYSDPEAMMRAQFGWTIPVGAMRWWLLGLPQPGQDFIEESRPDGLVVALQQREWTIDYDRYTEYGNWLMPQKIVLTSPEVTIRLAIHEWNLTPN